jgi:molecular chaperone DnaJ
MDHYKTLMVARTASAEDIQKAYHELAVKFHPDANPGDSTVAERFKEINKAYQVLRDAKKRKEYDLTLSGGPSQQARRAPGAAPASGPAAGARTTTVTGNPLNDILGDMMGSARAAAAAEGKPAGEGASSGVPTVEIKITTREALAGTVKTILVNKRPLRIKITVIR